MENSLLLAWNLFWIVAPAVVYLDATQQKIGKIGQRSFLNIPAGGWGAAVLIIAIIALPLYLIKRRALIIKAKENPVYISKAQRTVVGIVLLAFGIAFTLLFSGAFGPA